MRQIDEEDLRRAAASLVKTALRVAPGERFAIVGDAESQPMLGALEAAGRDAGAEVSALRLDQLRSYSTNHSGERPHKVLPDAVRRAMLSAQASAFVASAPHAESSMREQLQHVVGACGLRHAHMPGIRPLAFATGLSVDFDDLARRGADLEQRLAGTEELLAEGAGTALAVHLARPTRWVARVGRVGAGEVVAFPAGSLVASPESVSGTFVADASLGEFFGAREGLLREPVSFTIEQGRVTGVSAPGCPELLRDLEAMLHVAPCSDRVGLVVLGLNDALAEPTGDASVDVHRVGLHLVFGDPLPKQTGAAWSARTSVAACQARGAVHDAKGALLEPG